MAPLRRIPIWLAVASFPLVVALQTAPVTALARQALPAEVWEQARLWHLTHRSAWFRMPTSNPAFAIPHPERRALARAANLRWPVPRNTRVSSSYGPRRHPVLRFHTLHNGIDLAVPIGTPVWASQDGVVDATGHDNRSGIWMSLDHGGGVRTVYCHLSSRAAERGERVTAGAVIAASGNTGASTGAHLHWAVKVHGRSIDPVGAAP